MDLNKMWVQMTGFIKQITKEGLRSSTQEKGVHIQKPGSRVKQFQKVFFLEKVKFTEEEK